MKRIIPKLVFVDDHEVMRDGLSFMMENIGIATVIGKFNNATDFLFFIKKNKPDIVLMDIKMPGMDGVEASRQALELYPDLKILILTMQTDTELYNELIDIGVKGFLLKESRPEELKKAIDAVMKDTHYFAQELLMKLIRFHNNKREAIISSREREVLTLLAEGYSNAEISEKLFISTRTIEKHRSELLIKSGCKNSISLVVYAIKNKIIDI